MDVDADPRLGASLKAWLLQTRVDAQPPRRGLRFAFVVPRNSFFKSRQHGALYVEIRLDVCALSVLDLMTVAGSGLLQPGAKR